MGSTRSRGRGMPDRSRRDRHTPSMCWQVTAASCPRARRSCTSGRSPENIAPTGLDSTPAWRERWRCFRLDARSPSSPGSHTASRIPTAPAARQRGLVAFGHRREAVGFTIVPQPRWTVPERADEPASTIYARQDQVLYFQPFAAREYNDLAYAHLTNPQSAEGRSDGWRWQYTQSLAGSRLQVAGPSGVGTITSPPYRVEQKTGEALGYEVIERPIGQTADFTGFKIQVHGTMQGGLLDAS